MDVGVAQHGIAVQRIVLRMVTAELARPFENRWQRFRTWTKVVVEVDAGGVSGFGECTAMETPYYNYETVETAWHILDRYLAPSVLRLVDATPAAAAEAWHDVNGHEEAKGALEVALWDLGARIAGRPLCVELGGAVRPVQVGATAGIESSIDALLDRVGELAAAGYRRVRVKIRPGWDLEPLRAVRSAFPDLALAADANAAYGEDDVDRLTALDDVALLAVEQPFPRHLLEATAELQRRLATAVCLDESVKSVFDARRAARLRACRLVNIKVGRVGGLGEAVRIHDFCRDEGLPTFVGAKWEQGIGRWTNLALATLPNMTLPSDTGPSSAYYVDDGVEPKVRFTEPGVVTPLDVPGTGAKPNGALAVARQKEFVRSAVRVA
jgi:O-succinylbenzoate synthase